VDSQTREQLKAQYPNLKLVPLTAENLGIEIVVMPAPPAVWAKYKALSGDWGDAGKRTQASELLVLGSMVYPDKDSFRKELQDRHLTGFYDTAAEEIAKLTGARERLTVGEL
jgi:hypothetical protein